MEHRRRFAEAVHAPDAEVPLDLAWALLSAHAHPAVDPDGLLLQLDDLAAGCRVPTLDGLLRHLFVDQGFVGNQDDYYDPANSYLDDVLETHLGIPISLAVLTMEVGRRVGVPVAGVGLPGHFLLRDRVDPEVFIDPFRGGELLDRNGCRTVLRRLHGPDTELDPAWLEPVPRRAILDRMLANLVRVFQQRGDASDLLWARDLQAELAGAKGDPRTRLRLRAGLN
ncbi:MAG: transglutaminase-like domain-containing protein [Acidimicrobiales bacterium]|nr:transglutaminase-like domain-containing protein [Actinomycetota bacterium]